MGNDYDPTTAAKPDQSRNYKLISDPYLRPGHRVLFRYDGLSCQHRSPIQACDPRKLKASDPRSRRITELPIPDYAVKDVKFANCTLNSQPSPPISFSPPPASRSTDDFVNLDGLSLSREELIKLVQNYRNSKSLSKRPRRRRERRSRHHSPQLRHKRSRQGSESSNVSYSTPTADSHNSNELSEQTEPDKEPKESLDSRIAALLGTDQQQQQPPVTMPALVFPSFFPNPASMYNAPPFYDPLRPPPPLPFQQPVNFAGFGTVLRPTVPPMYFAGSEAYQRPPASVMPPASQSSIQPLLQPRPQMAQSPEELRNQVICILCGELNTVVRRDLSRKVLSGVAYKCIDDWYEANDKRNKILQSGKYLKNSCVAVEETKSESLTNGPIKTEPTVATTSTARPYQPIPKFTSSLKREAKPDKSRDAPCPEEKKFAKGNEVPTADKETPDRTGNVSEDCVQESTGDVEEELVVCLKTIYAHITQSVQPDNAEELDGLVQLADAGVTLPHCFEAVVEKAGRAVPPESQDSERKGSRLDRLLLPTVEAPCTRSLRKRSNAAKYQVRGVEEDVRNTRSYLIDGIDREDIQYLKKAHDEIMNGKVMPAWMGGTTWVDHPPTKLSDPAGCARTLGYCKLSPSKKNVQYGPAAAKFSAPVPVRTRSRKEGALRSVGREVRSMQRRLMANIADTDFAEIFRFSQLKLRKKRLQFGRSRIHDWGLFACEYIAAEEMVIEYVGETIRQTVADKREQRQMLQASRTGNSAAGASSYLFRIDADTIIDATNCGNLARFINHSCDPNCYAKIITVDQCKKVVIYSKREIAPGEEITYDYKFPLEDKKIPCNCGAPNCRKTLN